MWRTYPRAIELREGGSVKLSCRPAGSGHINLVERIKEQSSMGSLGSKSDRSINEQVKHSTGIKAKNSLIKVNIKKSYFSNLRHV